MAGSDYTDYYQFEWEVVVGHQIGGSSKKFKVFILFLIFLVLSGFLKLLNDYLDFSTYEFFWVMFFFLVLIIGVIGVFWEQLSNDSSSVEIHRYKISRTGLEINSRQYDFSQFKKQESASLLENFEQVLIETPTSYFINLPLIKSTLKVYFSNQKEALRFAKALKYYLKL